MLSENGRVEVMMLDCLTCGSYREGTLRLSILINVNIKMYIFDHLRMYIFAILPLDQYIFLIDKIFQ